MKTLRVVVADDDADMRYYFARVLPRLGCTVAGVAENGRDLVEQCHAQHPDVIITDIRMPEMDGMSAIAEINREQPTPAIVISSAEKSELQESMYSLIVQYLVKPFKLHELQAALSTVAISNSHHEQEKKNVG